MARRLPLLPSLLLLLAAPAVHADEDTYRQLELFARVLSYVENNYVEPVDDRRLMYGAIKGMLETLDPHTVFMTPEEFRQVRMDTSGAFGGLGVELSLQQEVITVVAPLEDTPAARAGIKAGDRILEIDGERTRGMTLPQAIARLRGPPGQRVFLEIMREGFAAPRGIEVVREQIHVVSVEGSLYEGIGHVRVKTFQERTDGHLRRELLRLRGENGGRPLRGLILDLRNNPGGLLDQAVAVSDRFLAGGLTIVTTKGRGGRHTTEERSRDAEAEAGYPMVVLVNAGSASASEIVAGALQDHRRAVLMGTATFGKGSVQTLIELGDGSGLKLTIARYYTPSGRSIQERGITPDFLVPEAQGQEPVVREKDLARHFRAEPQAPASSLEGPPRLPEPRRPSPASEAMADYPLKIALEYLNGAELAARPRSHR